MENNKEIKAMEVNESINKKDKYVLNEKQKWLKKFSGKYTKELIGDCTMPGCKNKIYEDNEYYTDDSGNIFCSRECVFEWYGISLNS